MTTPNSEPLKDEILSELRQILGNGAVLSDPELTMKYASDETEDFVFPPGCVVKPSTTAEVSEVMKLAYRHRIPVTPLGALTGLSGGALAVKGGIGMSLERMNKILRIDEDNFQVWVEPAVITQHLQEEVKKRGLMYPPDPASRGSCTIGGNLAENSGGPKALKYGVTSDYVLNLQVVLPNGNIIWTGANVLKNATGYNLTQLFVGSEGTLGVITQAVLKLIPHPAFDVLMLIPFKSARDACRCVAEIFKKGISPSALEFMERDAIEYTCAFTGETPVALEPDDQAHLLVELDGNEMEEIYRQCEQVEAVTRTFEVGEIYLAEDQASKDRLWSLRRKVGEAVKARSVYKEEDTVVPRYYLPELLDVVKNIGRKYGFRSVCYGHAGDGNLHVNILKENLDDEHWNNALKVAIRELFAEVKRLGGTLSGEHGIGYVQRDYLDVFFAPEHIELMKQIKEVFDPLGIMNPGKIFPE
ncbi:MAG: FAD-linked oxidase C-terminal domain-containing protein [Salibacteraceae bacterium]